MIQLLVMMNSLMISLEMNRRKAFFFWYNFHNIYCDIMKRINLSDYNSNLGILIDVKHPLDYKEDPTPGSINIYADKLLMNYKMLLDYKKKYYIICSKGTLSRKVVAYLEYLGYDVTQVVK